MSTPIKDDHDPADDIAVSFGQFKQIVVKLEEKINRDKADTDRRIDEAISASRNDTRIEMNNLRTELGTGINQLAEGQRIILQKFSSNSKNSDTVAEVIDLLKPAIQKRLGVEPPEDELLGETNKLGGLLVKGWLRGTARAFNREIGKMQSKGLIFQEEIQAAGVTENILDKSIDKHARI